VGAAVDIVAAAFNSVRNVGNTNSGDASSSSGDSSDPGSLADRGHNRGARAPPQPDACQLGELTAAVQQLKTAQQRQITQLQQQLQQQLQTAVQQQAADLSQQADTAARQASLAFEAQHAALVQTQQQQHDQRYDALTQQVHRLQAALQRQQQQQQQQHPSEQVAAAVHQRVADLAKQLTAFQQQQAQQQQRYAQQQQHQQQLMSTLQEQVESLQQRRQQQDDTTQPQPAIPAQELTTLQQGLATLQQAVTTLQQQYTAMQQQHASSAQLCSEREQQLQTSLEKQESLVNLTFEDTKRLDQDSVQLSARLDRELARLEVRHIQQQQVQHKHAAALKEVREVMQQCQAGIKDLQGKSSGLLQEVYGKDGGLSATVRTLCGTSTRYGKQQHQMQQQLAAVDKQLRQLQQCNQQPQPVAAPPLEDAADSHSAASQPPQQQERPLAPQRQQQQQQQEVPPAVSDAAAAAAAAMAAAEAAQVQVEQLTQQVQAQLSALAALPLRTVEDAATVRTALDRGASAYMELGQVRESLGQLDTQITEASRQLTDQQRHVRQLQQQQQGCHIAIRSSMPLQRMQLRDMISATAGVDQADILGITVFSGSAVSAAEGAPQLVRPQQQAPPPQQLGHTLALQPGVPWGQQQRPQQQQQQEGVHRQQQPPLAPPGLSRPLHPQQQQQGQDRLAAPPGLGTELQQMLPPPPPQPQQQQQLPPPPPSPPQQQQQQLPPPPPPQPQQQQHLPPPPPSPPQQQLPPPLPPPQQQQQAPPPPPPPQQPQQQRLSQPREQPQPTILYRVKVTSPEVAARIVSKTTKSRLHEARTGVYVEHWLTPSQLSERRSMDGLISELKQQRTPWRWALERPTELQKLVRSPNGRRHWQVAYPSPATN
jgi:hypothetical protein